MEALAGEFLTYLFKFVILGAVAVAGVILGAKYKKSKLSRQAAEEAENQKEA